MSVKKILSDAASIIKLFILLILFITNSKAEETNIKHYSEDMGTLAIMYHRFNEDKYPSTNIQMDIFKNQLEIIKQLNLQFYDPKEFSNKFNFSKKEKKILITIDDAFISFYENAWPLLKKNKIPFILFVSTEAIGKYDYMNWSQIKELNEEEFVEIGNHSHSHEYLVDEDDMIIKEDIQKSINIFNKKLGKNSNFFSYPFGEYSVSFKNIIKSLGFKYAFGQHSGVIDETKNFYELPRFPINEKYGEYSNNFKNIIKKFDFKYAFGQHSGVVDETKDFYELPRFPINEAYGELKRFKTVLKTIPLKFVSMLPEEKYITDDNNPPQIIVEFFDNLKNIKLLNCYSNEQNSWRKSEIEYLEDFKIKINLIGKFTTERGRVNCSLRTSDGSWRWLGIQFVVADL